MRSPRDLPLLFRVAATVGPTAPVQQEVLISAARICGIEDEDYRLAGGFSRTGGAAIRALAAVRDEGAAEILHRPAGSVDGGRVVDYSVALRETPGRAGGKDAAVRAQEILGTLPAGLHGPRVVLCAATMFTSEAFPRIAAGPP
jgi:hypothetical protein